MLGDLLELFSPSNPTAFYLGNEQYTVTADEVYVVDGCWLPVHRAVLCKHSSVFREAYGMQEEMEQVAPVERQATRPAATVGWNPFQGFSAMEAALFLRLLYHPRDANLHLHSLPGPELRALARLAHMFDIGWLLMGLESALCHDIVRRAPGGGTGSGSSTSHGSGEESSVEQLVADIELAEELHLQKLRVKTLGAIATWLAKRPHERMQASFLESSQLARLSANNLAMLLGGF